MRRSRLGTGRIGAVAAVLMATIGGAVATTTAPAAAQWPEVPPGQLLVQTPLAPPGHAVHVWGTCALTSGTFPLALVGTGGSTTIDVPAPQPASNGFWFADIVVPWTTQPGPATLISGCPDPATAPASFTVIAPRLPEAPTAVTVAPGNGFTTISWQPPQPEHLGIWYYSVVTTRDGLFDRWVNVPADATSVSIPATNGAATSAYVTAVTRHGPGPTAGPAHGAATELARSRGPAAAPQQVTAQGFYGRSITARWKAPADDGGAPILAYALVAVPRSGGPSVWDTVGADVRDAVIAGLVPDQYDLFVFALTDAGFGTPVSLPATVHDTVFNLTSDPPRDVSLRHTPTGTVVAWRPPYPTSSPVLGYSVIALQGGQVVAWANTDRYGRHVVLPQLRLPLPATTIQIIAFNASGYGRPALAPTGG